MLPSSNILELFPDKFIVWPSTGCWLFTGALNKKGYGKVRYQGQVVQTHRLSAHLSLGLDMNDTRIHALHKVPCPFKHCANPEHLYLGDNFDNQRDSVTSGSHVSPQSFQTHCKYGHPLSGDNLYIPSDGRRRCKICRANTQKNRHSKTTTTTVE